MNQKYYLRCVSTHKRYDETETCTSCPETGDALEVVFDLDEIAQELNEYVLRHAPVSAAKYLSFYPIKDRSQVVSLNEGGTPLYHLKNIGEQYGLPKLYLKHEGANPTGVYKDRGSLVEITKAKELGATAIAVASTGNMAASVAAYASQAGLPCYVFIPEGTPIGKLSQTLQYGGTLLQIRGDYHDCVVLSEQLAKEQQMYLAGDYAFRAEGSKSIAFEVIEQLNWQVPDVVICPVGCGTNLAGIGKGFREWYEMGLIDRVPRLIAVQPEGCDTICSSANAGEERYRAVKHPRTIASAVGINTPLDDVKVLNEIRYSHGLGQTATDEQILTAQRELAKRESVFVEPSSAIPIATLERLLADGNISADETIVCIATGTGLKDPATALKSFAEPQSIEPKFEAVLQALKTGTPQRSLAESEEPLITESMSDEQLRVLLQKEFSFVPTEMMLMDIQAECALFLGRGKEIGQADLLSIVEEAIEDANAPQEPLAIVDWSIHNSLKDSPTATLTARVGKEEYTASAEGVGPVDALVTALRDILEQSSTAVPKLKDYAVSVTSSRTNAVVKVRMEMSTADDTRRIRSTATSPDIIVASLNAYVKGVNILVADA